MSNRYNMSTVLYRHFGFITSSIFRVGILIIGSSESLMETDGKDIELAMSLKHWYKIEDMDISNKTNTIFQSMKILNNLVKYFSPTS